MPKEKKERVKKPKGEGRKPRLAPFVEEGFNITAKGGGKEFEARVRKDGMIVFKDKEYFSPSAAAKAALPERSIDGWGFWTLKNDKGERVPLDTLRGAKSPLKVVDAKPKKARKAKAPKVAKVKSVRKPRASTTKANSLPHPPSTDDPQVENAETAA